MGAGSKPVGGTGPGAEATPVGGWNDPDQVRWYVDRLDRIPARRTGEDRLLAELPIAPRTLLDLGCGDGRLTSLVLAARPTLSKVVAVDRSPAMLARADKRFAGDRRVEVRPFDLANPVGELGSFDIVVSGFAIHHLEDDRKRALFGEIAGLLTPGGRFCNLEVVASSSAELHAAFLAAVGRTADDPEDRLADTDAQAVWMREAGLVGVDTVWRWRGFALLVGSRPVT